MSLTHKIELIIEEALASIEEQQTQEQMIQAGEESRNDELKKHMEAYAKQQQEKEQEFQKMIDANNSSVPEMGDGNPFDEIGDTIQ